jgi:hypothetical protein
MSMITGRAGIRGFGALSSFFAPQYCGATQTETVVAASIAEDPNKVWR